MGKGNPLFLIASDSHRYRHRHQACRMRRRRRHKVCYRGANRYPRMEYGALAERIANSNNVKPEQVLLGCGSTEILRVAAFTFLNDGRQLIQASPTFEAIEHYARAAGSKVTLVGRPIPFHFRLGSGAWPGFHTLADDWIPTTTEKAFAKAAVGRVVDVNQRLPSDPAPGPVPQIQ